MYAVVVEIFGNYCLIGGLYDFCTVFCTIFAPLWLAFFNTTITICYYLFRYKIKKVI